MGIIKTLRLFLCKDLVNQNKFLKKYISELKTLLNVTITERDNFKNRLFKFIESNVSELDEYCQNNFKEIPKIAYKQKRDIKGKKYTISLHELITFDSWEVKNFFKNLPKDLDKYDKIKEIGNKIAKNLTWDSDHNLDKSGDYYLYPNESIARKLCDCEDHSFVACSAVEEIGGAWGFHYSNGHAFNVFVWNDQLYVMDTTFKTVHIEKYTEKSKYKIHYIITKNHAYELKGGIQFGQIAGWR